MSESEQRFLHDIAGQIAICALLTNLLEDPRDEFRQTQLSKLKKSLVAIEGMLQNRRQIVSDQLQT